MTISNQFFAIPPDHPLAVELFDLIGLQKVLIDQLNREAATVTAGGDRTLFDQSSIARGMVDREIKSVLEKHRLERGGDETCTVGLTTDVRGYPLVKGRPCLTIH
jgi:hypothetical protein